VAIPRTSLAARSAGRSSLASVSLRASLKIEGAKAVSVVFRRHARVAIRRAACSCAATNPVGRPHQSVRSACRPSGGSASGGRLVEQPIRLHDGAVMAVAGGAVDQQVATPVRADVAEGTHETCTGPQAFFTVVNHQLARPEIATARSDSIATTVALV